MRNKGKKREIEGHLYNEKRDAPVPQLARPWDISDHQRSTVRVKEVRKGVVARDTWMVLGIDPGFTGALVGIDGKGYFRCVSIPTFGKKEYKRIDHEVLREILKSFIGDHWMPRVYLERAIPMAMGSKGAFTYGRGFESVVMCLELSGIAYELVEPSRWTKEMHASFNKGLKPKAKSQLAVRKFFPEFVRRLPRNRNGVLLDGPVDALLIAGYGLRMLNPQEDF